MLFRRRTQYWLVRISVFTLLSVILGRGIYHGFSGYPEIQDARIERLLGSGGIGLEEGNRASCYLNFMDGGKAHVKG